MFEDRSSEEAFLLQLEVFQSPHLLLVFQECLRIPSALEVLVNLLYVHQVCELKQMIFDWEAKRCFGKILASLFRIQTS